MPVHCRSIREPRRCRRAAREAAGLFVKCALVLDAHQDHRGAGDVFALTRLDVLHLELDIH